MPTIAAKRLGVIFMVVKELVSIGFRPIRSDESPKGNSSSVAT